MRNAEQDQSLILLKKLRSAVEHGAFAGITDVSELIGRLPVIHIVRHGETHANLEKRINDPAEHMPYTAYAASTSIAYPYRDRGNAGLTEKGIGQIAETATTLKALANPPTVMVVSPQERAYETGRHAAKQLGISEMTVDPALREREFGPYAGVPIVQVATLCAARNAELQQKQTTGSAIARKLYTSFTPDELIGEFHQANGVTAQWINQTPKTPREKAGETWPQCQQRIVAAMVDAMVDAMAKNPESKSIALATHGDVSRMAVAAYHGIGWREILSHGNEYLGEVRNGMVMTLDMNKALENLLAKEKLQHESPNTMPGGLQHG